MCYNFLMSSLSQNLKRAGLLGLILTLMLWPSASRAQTNENPKLVVLLINATTLQEIQDANLPTVKRLMSEKKLAVGLMNVRSAKAAYTPTSGYLTLGAGAKADAGPLGSMAFNAYEHFDFKNRNYSASEWYKQNTAYRLNGRQVASLATADISRLSTAYDYDLKPGLIGKLLADSGVKRAVIGNADSAGDYHREAAMIAMDTTGKVDYGDVSKPATLAKTQKYLKKASFVVVELGNTARTDYNRRFLTDKRYAALKKGALKQMDWFLNNLLKRMDLKKDMVMIVSPTSSELSIKQRNLLAPVMIVKSGQENMVYSPSTRWPGIVDSLDFAPTVLKFFSIPQPAEMNGNSLISKAGSAEPFEALLTEEQTAVVNMNSRSMLTGYAVLVIISLIIILTLLLLPGIKPGAYKFAKGLLVFILSVPLVFLLLGLLKYSNPWILLIGAPLAGLLLTLVLMSVFREKTHLAILGLMAATAIFVIVDILTGFSMMRHSLLGFSPIIGARFYGIGNEYSGVVVATIVLSLCWLAEENKLLQSNLKTLAVIAFAAAAFVIGFPSLGADVGGALAALVTFFFAIIYLAGTRFTWKQPVVLACGLVGVVVLIMLSDKIMGIQTHAGRAGQLVAQGGLSEALLIFKRKILVNLKLLKFTSWTNALIAMLATMLVLMAKKSGELRQIKERWPHLWAGLVGVGFGSIAAFLFNDSGVVAAFTSMLYAIAVILYVIIDGQQKQVML